VISGEVYGNNQHGPIQVLTSVVVCPSPSCRGLEVSLAVAKVKHAIRSSSVEKPFFNCRVIPSSSAKQFPDYIPQQILSDYQEAHLISELSPKASATLSRRCLQGMIRDFWGISRSRLIDEIRELEQHIDKETWQAIDAVRSIGNIGAHMERDIDKIIDVDPGEALFLLQLIEMLIQEWYIARHEREERLKAIVGVSSDKQAERANRDTG
jgi:hypothetical protein